MTTPQWSDAPEPTNPVAALFDVPVVDSDPPHVVPNHRATVDSEMQAPEPTSPFRERFLKNKTKPVARDTRPPKTQKVVPNRPGQFVEPLTDFYNTMALVAMPFKPQVAMVILGPCRPQTEEEAARDAQPPTVAENCARAWDEGAQRSESLRRVLDTFLTVGVVGTIIAAHTPIIMSLAGDKFNPAAVMEAMLKREAER